MKKVLKNMIPAFLLSFLTSFMLFIYEPIITYTANVNDFWFDSGLMLPSILLFFTILFCGMFLLYSIIYLFSHLIKKEIIYKVVLAISIVFFVYIYIQGNFLVGHLPSLDGTTIEWSNYTKDGIVSIIVLSIVLLAEIIAIIKLSINKTLKINCYLMCAIFIMLLTSFVSSLTKPDFYKDKTMATATYDNINNVSSNKNYIIFLADAVDSLRFAEITDDENIFKDFTYYQDTLSGYTYTRDSIPFIFSGIWNKNEMEFSEYSTKAYNDSPILNRLKKENYQLNMYEKEIVWNSRKAEEISNLYIYNNNLDNISFFKQLAKYIGFKYLPFQLKKYSRIERADFDLCRIETEKQFYDWFNPEIYKMIKENNLDTIDQKYFQYIHIEGGHVPFDNNEEVETIPEEEGDYDKKMKATAKIIETYIQRLKDAGVYDNSVIIVLADHGYWTSERGNRHNPILYIKGFNEHHDLYTSELPISYEDLSDAFLELLDGKKSDELFSRIDKNRVRVFLDNPPEGEDSMPEFEQHGKAWEKKTIVETGTKYER